MDGVLGRADRIAVDECYLVADAEHFSYDGGGPDFAHDDLLVQVNIRTVLLNSRSYSHRTTHRAKSYLPACGTER